MANRATFTGLKPYQLTRVELTDRELGHGSYASVIELKYMGLKCAGKKIHEPLLRQGDNSYTVRRFEEECHLFSQIRHPNIVQFLGVYFQQRTSVPILVMEFLPTNLTSCVEQHVTLPKEVSYSILHDVALGLCYLHSQTPAIIHRDLSSNNVLLTPNMTAKISDLGVARILNLTPIQVKRLTQTPGTPAFMPPEVMVASPNYNKSVDTFSYGVMMVHIFSGRWPEPHIGPVRTEPAGRLIPVSEAERREVFLQTIGNEHPLMDLILKCIDNHPPGRAYAEEIVERLAEMVSQFPMSFVNQLDTLRHIESAEEKRSLTEELERKNAEIDDNNVEIECSRELIKSLREEVERGDAEIQKRDGLIAQMQANEQQLVGRIQSAEKEKKSLKEDVKRKKADIERKSAEIYGLREIFQIKERELLGCIKSAEEVKKTLQKEVSTLRANETEYKATTERLNEDVRREQHKNEEMLKLIHRHEFEIVQLKKMLMTPVQFLKADDGSTSSNKDGNVDIQVSHLQGSNAKKDCTKTEKSLDSGTFNFVEQPDGTTRENWIAVNVMNFYDQINTIYGKVCHACTDDSCPKMSGGPKFEYHWTDEEQRRPQVLPAPKYITKLMSWIGKQINDEHIFPRNHKAAIPAPTVIVPVCKKILTRLYRVFVHLYVHHYDMFVEINEETILNSCYVHFYCFVNEFDLVSSKEFEPLTKLNFQLFVKGKFLQSVSCCSVHT